MTTTQLTSATTIIATRAGTLSSVVTIETFARSIVPPDPNAAVVLVIASRATS